MNAVYEAKLGRAAGDIKLPDYQGSLADGPSDDFVLSYRRDGTAVSRFGDLVWDFTAYHPEQRKFGLYFSYWGDTSATPTQLAQSRIVRRVIFSLIWNRPGASLALRTLANYLIVLCAAARHADELGVSLGHLLGDAKVLRNFGENNCSGWGRETLGSLLGTLVRSGEEAIGFRIVPSETINAIKSHGKTYRAGIKQHAPMPTRIYSYFISSLQQELADWLVVSDEVLRLARDCGADPFLGRSYFQQRDVIAKKLGVEWNSFEPRSTFEDLCSQTVASYLISSDKDLNVKGLSVVIAEMQVVCKLTIQTFTGMRDDEVCSLPYDCREVTVADGKSHYVVKGRTTKFNHGLPKRTRWVTNKEGQKAVEVAQAIADAIYSVFDSTAPISASQRSERPLFPSTGYLNLASVPMTPEDGHFVQGTLEFRSGSPLPKRLFSPLEEDDLCELEQIDPHRAWRTEDAFQIGRPWAFKTHQLRRSLALYAQRSGLVSLPSLRRQLQHLTEEMSRYYAKGSSFAKDFIGGDKDHFGMEWQVTQPESGALGYILNVLLSDETVIGGHANWVQHRLKGKDGNVLIDREATMRRFKKGEMAYKETLLGGCTNVEDCDQVALKWLSVDCLRDGCKNLVCSLTKLERVVAAQERLVAAIDPNSVEYRTETADLEVLRSAMQKAKQGTVGVTR